MHRGHIELVAGDAERTAFGRERTLAIGDSIDDQFGDRRNAAVVDARNLRREYPLCH